MRFALPLAFLVLVGCDRSDAPPKQEQASAETGLVVYAGAGRDRLCLRQEQGGVAGFVTYAPQGNSNCMVRGTLDRQAGAIVPNGDSSCRIPVQLEGNEARLGPVSDACTYYCGPKASFAGKSFSVSNPGGEAVDVAGDPLC